MQQLTCVSKNKIEWTEVPTPKLSSDVQALVRPLAVARCVIDPFMISGRIPFHQPFALGHEGVGEIVELGSNVRGFEVGQRVVVGFQISCGRCATCGRGHTANCADMPVLSDYGMQPLSGVEYGGFLSDLVQVPYADAMMHPVPEGADPAALASVSDNVLDGYRAVAPHLREKPGATVLIVTGGESSCLGLYALQAALALGAKQVDVVSDDKSTLSHAEDLGGNPIESDFLHRIGSYPIVVDAGHKAKSLQFAMRNTEPEGICQSICYYPQDVPIPTGRLYTLGIRFYIGRAHASALLPEVMDLIATGLLHPERVTTRTVDWSSAADAYLEPETKMVVTRY